MSNPAIETALVQMETPRTGVDHLIQRKQMIDDAIARTMEEGKHYGVIPGTQRKALLKPGAEALQALFNFSCSEDTESIDYPDQHREVRAKCTIYDASGRLLVERHASCTTFESKYRWRTENTGALVPKAYFTDGDPQFHNKDVLGGADYSPRKIDGRWFIVHRIEVTNPADVWNTVLAMAQKRAWVAAIIIACGASAMLVDEDDPTYRTTRRKTSPPPATPRERGAPIDPLAESNDRRIVVLARLEEVAQQGEAAFLGEWADLKESDRGLVGKEFARMRAVAQQIAPAKAANDDGDRFAE